jgi:hypothetical protein
VNHRLTLIAGFPGCGKTTFACWLADRQQYLQVDMERGGLDRVGLRQTWDNFVSGVDRDAFIAQLFTRSSKIVLDWNFPPSALELVAALRERGCEIWWFEGDRLAARQRFLERGTEPAIAFDCHVGNVCAAWRHIAPLVGDNIVRTINVDASFVPHEDVWQRFTRKSA